MSAPPAAYGAAWSLLGDLLLNGLNANNLATVLEIPELAAEVALPFDGESEAARHYELFGLNVFPYASSFLTADGLLEGEVSHQIHALYRAYDFEVYAQPVAADHLGLIALFLARLAWRSAANHGDERSLALQRDVVATWLLPWLPAFFHAVQRQATPFYEAVVALLLALSLSLLRDGEVVAAPLLPAGVDPLAERRSGLREIAAFLSHPAQSGLFLSRNDIARAAHQLALPRGFGSRADTVENTLRSAAQYDAFPALVAALRGIWQRELDGYTTLQTANPALSAVATTWQARITHAIALLERMVEVDRG